MENGFGNLADELSGLTVTDPNNNNNDNDNLFQVMKAVEAAEAAIKKQVEEINQLRTQLYKKTQELEKHKSDESMNQGPHSVDPWNEHAHGPYKAHHTVPSVSNQDDRVRSIANTSSVALQDTLVIRPGSTPNSWDPGMQTSKEKHTESSKMNGTLNVLHSSQAPADSAGFSQFSSPSAAPFSPSRYQMEGEYDPRLNLSGQGSMPMTEVNNSSTVWKQDLVVKIQQHEEEMTLLQKHLAEYSIKEAQVRHEKYVLEKRIAHMRLAFDQQQQDLVDAASKALSYRQEIIEENIRLTYALQDAEQERSTFISSLLPLLAEYSLQPSVLDAQSIVSNIKVLFKHLQEKLSYTEAKLKESQYQLTPWHSDVNPSNVSPRSPSHFLGGMMTSNKKGFELVHQPVYSHGNVPSSSSDAQTTTDRDILGRHQSLGGLMAKNMEIDDLGRYSPLASRNAAAHDAHMQLAMSITQGDARATLYGEETTSKQVTFSDPVSSSEMDHRVAEGYRNERETSVNWGSGSSTYTTTLGDPNSTHSPYLPPVLEEPSSSFSEAADDDPLPAIEGLQISGEAFPGRELQASGYSINGTTSCNFEWVRHHENGSVNYIEGAKQPNYIVTADDVDARLVIEVQPLDNRKRKGELVRVFANEQRKITCDPEMQNVIEKTFYSGHASYKLSISTGYLDIWEPATLTIKRDGYSIKCSGPSGIIVTEKFSPATRVTIPYGQGTEFSVTGSGGVESLLRTDGSLTDVSCSRDTIVLTMRLFIIRYGSILPRSRSTEIRKAGEKRKGKKKSLFFNK